MAGAIRMLGRAMTMLVGLIVASCIYTAEDEVHYAVGYGYVVQAKAEMQTGDGMSVDVFFIFESEEEARKFVEEMKRNPRLVPDPAIRRVLRTGSYERTWEDIHDKRRLLPARARPDAIERVMPPVPTGPAPQ